MCIKERSPWNVSFTHTKHVFSSVVFKISQNYPLFSVFIVSEFYFGKNWSSNFQGFTVFLSLKIDFLLANGECPGEIPHYTAFFSTGSSPFAKIPIKGFPAYKRLIYEFDLLNDSPL